MRLCIGALLVCCVTAATAAEITIGMASVDDGKPNRYDGASFNGKISTGERFTDGMRVAHRTLPLGSCVDVSIVGRGAQIYKAKIDDRGPCGTEICRKNSPWLLNRLIDLKPQLAAAIGCDGLCRVAFWPAPCSGN